MKLISSIQFVENIFSFFLHLFSLNNKKIKLLFSENDIINELMDIIYNILNNQGTSIDLSYSKSGLFVSDEITGSTINVSTNDINNNSPTGIDKVSKIKEKFELPIYNLVIAMATSSIVEDWKSLHALNNVINVRK